MNDLQPSRTALSVATHLLLLSQDQKFGKLISDEAVEPLQWFLNNTKEGARSVQWIQNRWIRAYMRFMERMILPGLTMHFALRKSWIEERVHRLLLAGVRQIVVVGAGFDTLTYRLHHRYPNVRFVEIDHPATQHVKYSSYEKNGVLHDNLSFCTIDLTKQSLTDILLENPDFDREACTVFIVEGLLMYLPEENVRELLQSLYQIAQGEAWILGTALQPLTDGKLAFSEAKWLNPARSGEPFLWGEHFKHLHTFLKECAWEADELSYTIDHFSHCFPDEKARKIPTGEYLFSATNFVA